MPSALSQRWKRFERRLRESFDDSLPTEADRKRAWWHFQLYDHAFLRVWWTNFDTVAPGVFRSNQPSPTRLQAYANRGIKAVLNLRGEDGSGAWLLEKDMCARLGLQLHVAKIQPRRPSTREELQTLLATLRSLPRPFVLHCKSGADRAGLASVLYKLAIEGASLEDARKHLNWRYVHLNNKHTGILDHMIESWAARNAETGIGIEDWIATEYDPEALAADFRRERGL